MPQTGDRNRLRSRMDRYRLDTERVWYLALSVVCFVLIVAGAVSAAAVSPRFCTACHGRETDALTKSAHKTIACDRCHTAPSLAGVVDSRLAVVGMIPAQLVAGSGPAPTVIDNDRCVACHKDVLTATTTSKGLRMNHRALYEKKWSCTRCHPRTAHPSSRAPVLGYSMDVCMQCHTPTTADLTACDMCHVGKYPSVRQQAGATTPWGITHGPNWRKTHGMGNLNTCAACHQDGYCATCHKIDMPHPANFPSEHGKVVLSRESGTEDCFVCHKRTTCDNCHGIEMPHPTGFIKTHSKTVGRMGQAVCERCHAESSCLDCHATHIHPGLLPEVIKKLRARPAT